MPAKKRMRACRRRGPPPPPADAPPEAATTTTRDGSAHRVLWRAMRESSAITLQRAVRRSGLLDGGFVVL